MPAAFAEPARVSEPPRWNVLLTLQEARNQHDETILLHCWLMLDEKQQTKELERLHRLEG